MAREVRAARPEDAGALARVAHGALTEAWSAESYANTLADPHTRSLVACVDGVIVAFVLARLVVDELEVLTVATDAGQRRRGLARGLVDALLVGAREEGAANAFLEVRASNAGAIALYASRGFTAIERRARYYGDGEDAVIMHAPLAKPA